MSKITHPHISYELHDLDKAIEILISELKYLDKLESMIKSRYEY